MEQKRKNDNNHLYLKKLKKKIILSILDALIIEWLREENLSGQDCIDMIKKEYGFSLSPGTIYPLLSSLRDKGIIVLSPNGRKREYRLSERGEALSNKLVPFCKKIAENIKEHLNNHNSNHNYSFAKKYSDILNTFYKKL